MGQMEHVTFLEAMFGSKNPKSGYFLICRFNPIRTAWFKTIGEAVATITEGETNVFISAGLSPTDLGSSKKGAEKNVMGITGFSMDFDLKGEGHKKKDLFKSYAEIYETIAKFGLPPSILIKSGHGIQAWWLLPKPWIFTDTGIKESRIQAKELSKRLHYTFTTLTKRSIDSTFNIDRIMRLPGTINQKPSEKPVKVEIDQMNGLRYSIVDINAACLELPKEIFEKSKDCKNTKVNDHHHQDQSNVTTDSKLFLDLDAQPSFLLFDALRSSDAKFQLTWDKQRDKTEDNPDGFESASEYDLSLASFAHRAGWPDQEVANLIIAWRVKHKDDPNVNPNKGLRFDYMRRTIDIVKKKSDLRAADEIIRNTENAGGFKVYTEKDRKLALQTFIQKTGLEVIKYTKICGEQPVYIWELKVDGREFEVVVENRQNNKFGEWKNSVRGQTNKFARPMKQPEWESLLEIANAFMIEQVKENEASRQRTQVAAYIRSYLERKERTRNLDKAVAMLKEEPFKENGTWYIFADSLMQWCHLEKSSKQKKTYFTNGMNMLGMNWTKVQTKVKGKNKTKSYWPVPAKIFDDETSDDDCQEMDESEGYFADKVVELQKSVK